MRKIKIYVDMDGTIADIHGQENWFERTKEEEDFFQKLNPFNNLIVALFLIKFQYKDKVEICILSSVDDNKETNFAVKSKNKWIDENAGFIKKRIFSINGQPKSSFVNRITKRDILLDDYSKNLSDWVNCGGTGIKIKNDINCSGIVWNGKVIYNQDSISAIVTELDNTISELTQKKKFSFLNKIIKKIKNNYSNKVTAFN